MVLPRLAITIGDPSGIGPEVVGKALARSDAYDICQPIVLGDIRLIKNYKYISGKFPCRFVDIRISNAERIKTRQVSQASGKASYETIVKAVELVTNNEADAMVTGPVSKASMYLAGVHYSGQTELLADLTCTKHYAMLMIADNIWTVMITRHLPLTDVSKNIAINRITDTVELAVDFMKLRSGLKRVKIAVCALNPHGGEQGLLGKEERMVIGPSVNILKERGLDVSGPYPCDSAWTKVKKGMFNLLVTMYHDQAMIGLKCLKPQKIVNVTAGLPFVRTSPGHGTAFDIAGKNLADARPMKEAIYMAARLCRKNTTCTPAGPPRAGQRAR